MENLHLVTTILRAAEKRGDAWALKIKERISEDTDLPALDARYHRFCQRKLYRPPTRGLKRGGHIQSTVDVAMAKIFDFLEENSEECQFSLTELIEQIGENPPDIRTIKCHLFEKYGDHIVIAETSNRTPVICFKNSGYKILSHAWYAEKNQIFKKKDYG